MARKSGLAVAASGLILAFGVACGSSAQVVPRPIQSPTMTAQAGETWSTGVRKGRFDGKPTSYKAEIDQTIIRDSDGSRLASLYSYSYVAQPSDSRRPVIFAFNGGPGGASVFLHLGSLAPKIFTRDLGGGRAQLPLVDNPQSPLGVADLVFIDPADTGFSHSLDASTAPRIYSIDGDSEAMSQKVIDWLRRHNRMDSPVYLIGESYGTMRAVAMTRDLARSSPSIKVAGVMLAGNSLGYMQKGQMPDVLYAANALPMMASVAWYHGKIDNKNQSWEEAVEKARRFTRTEFISALMLGYRLDDKTREDIIGKLPDLIGIPSDYFRRTGKISILEEEFRAELLKDKGFVLDGDDGRITHPVNGPRDRSLATFEQAMGDFAKSLGANDLGTYAPVNFTLSPRWNFATAGDMALDVTLSKAAKANPRLRIMLVQGRYDTLTVLGNAEYIMRQTDLPLDRFDTVYYDGGHTLLAQPEIMSAIRAFVTGQKIVPWTIPPSPRSGS